MSRLDNIERAIIAMIIIFAVAILYVASYIPLNIIIESECLQKGYHEYRVDYKYDGYCIKTFGDITTIIKLD